MRVLHLNAGNETGGGMVHILSLLSQLKSDGIYLGLLEKKEFYYKAKERGINTLTFEQSSRYDLSVIKKLISFIKDEKIDIIHTHGARANLYGYFISKFTDVKWVITVHSDPRNDFLGRGMKGKMFTSLNLAVLRNADHFFAISTRFKEMVEGFGVNSSKITTIYNGVDFNEDQVSSRKVSRADLKLLQSDFVLLMVARFDPVKRHDIALKAVERVKHDYPIVKLLLLGDGQTKPEVENLVKSMGMENNVIFLGYKENVRDFYQLADITLLTSRTESFPLVLLESARENVPVITTDVGGVHEMIPDSKMGFIVPVDDEDSVANAIFKAIKLKEKGYLQIMGTRFNTFASENFSIQSFADSVYQAYQSL
ncbi:glycosyltransferase family 4 protein [Bacillus sp. ISL-37]|uniref:glycosyltransferase family 4 protein n=1 Tax=Bacillus sp. ISL-37 TaxID=2819123 RepID=UPI001BE7335E|nr:glycosyltransferase family 4 protein [Bacillus sp. ISL-37]MBT2685469.1 glycosyltransferase family 4 protein [Bacillus sp. ISL-37]